MPEAAPAKAADRQTLHVVGRDDDAEVCALLSAACGARGLRFQRVAPGPHGDQPTLARPPRAGDALLMVGTDLACQELAAALWRPGIASLQGHGDAPRQVGAAALAEAGVRMPRQFDPAPRDTAALLESARRLGAYPVLLRLPGREGGRGVMRVDSAPSLVSVRGALPDDVRLVEYVPHPVAWRIVVVGTEAVVSEAWRVAEDDFRSNVGGTLEPGRTPPAEVARMALAAAGLLGLRFAGVDVMEAADGGCCVAEVNSPCWFVDSQRRSGVDIAGLIVDALLPR